MRDHGALPARSTFASLDFAVILGGFLLIWPHATQAQQSQDRSDLLPPPAADSHDPAGDPSRTPGYLGLVSDDRGEQGQGVRVVQVLADGPAAQGGLRVGDLIISIDQEPVRSMADLAAIVRASEPEAIKNFEVRRDEEIVALAVQLGHRPAPQERPYSQFGRIESGHIGHRSVCQLAGAEGRRPAKRSDRVGRRPARSESPRLATACHAGRSRTNDAVVLLRGQPARTGVRHTRGILRRSGCCPTASRGAAHG